MSFNEWMIVIGAVGTGIGTLLGIILTKGVEAWEKFRATNRIDEAAALADKNTRAASDAASVEASLKYIVGRQDARITELEHKVDVLNEEHAKCERENAAMKVRIEFLETKGR